MRARYDGEIAFTDESVGAFLAELRRGGELDHTLVVITADHGEEFGDHGGFEHGRTLYQEQIHVPLLIRFPGAYAGGRVVSAVVRQIDIVPTILDALGAGAPADLPGRSLLPAIASEPDTAIEAAAETSLGGRESVALIIDGWKVIESKVLGATTTTAYNLRTDPLEHDERAQQRPILVGYARQALAQWRSGRTASDRGAPAPAHIDPAVLERLRALGYDD
jgi:arylsulfatase A-like enzyme